MSSLVDIGDIVSIHRYCSKQRIYLAEVVQVDRESDFQPLCVASLYGTGWPLSDNIKKKVYKVKLWHNENYADKSR